MPVTELDEIPLPPPLVLADPAVYTESPRPSLELPYEDGENLESNWHRPPDNLIADDGEPLESNWHALQIGLLIDVVHSHRRAETDFFAGGNMFVYYSREQARDRDYRGPDFFLVNHVPHKPDRPYWAIWDERALAAELAQLKSQLANPS